MNRVSRDISTPEVVVIVVAARGNTSGVQYPPSPGLGIDMLGKSVTALVLR